MLEYCCAWFVDENDVLDFNFLGIFEKIVFENDVGALYVKP
jgi:hypothetical protein